MKRPALADLPLRIKGLVMVAVPLAALLVAGGMLVLVEIDQQRAEQWVRHSLEVRAHVQTLMMLMGDAESGVRGYLLTRDQALLAPFARSTREFPKAAEELVELVQDDPQRVTQARRIQKSSQERLDSLGTVVSIFEQSGDPMALRSALAQSKQTMDAVRSELDRMQAGEQRLLTLRQADARQARTRMFVLLASSTLIGLLGGVLTPLVIGRSVVRRIVRLRERAQLLAERRPLPREPLGGDEVGKLGESLAHADRLLAERERDLRETEHFLQHLIETSPAVIFRQDPGSMAVTYVSPNCERILGYTPEQILSRPAFWLEHIHPEDRDRVLEEDRAALARNDPQVNLDYRLRHKNGEYRWLSSFLYLEYAEDGAPTGMLGHRLDITERKQFESDLKEREAKLDAANRELEAFSYSVSHDLRAPLRAVDGFSRILLEDCSEQLDTQGKYYLERMRTAAQHMGQLIEDLLKLSRITRAEMQFEEVDLSAMVRRIAEDLKESAPERQVEFVIEPDVTAVGDTGLLRVVLQNLMGNAWKFTSRHPSGRIEFGTDRRDGRITYFVRDDGAGFDPGFERKLFGAFQRLHSSSEFPGTGIGLATVQRIIHRHGGRVSATGAIEQGATFSFTLHAAQEGEAPRPIPAVAAGSHPA